MSGFRDRVVRQADSIAELYLEGERLGQPATREQKEFIQGVIAADYDGRTVVELLQNGHDAHPADRRDGRIEFLLAEDEHEFGVLNAANGGRPVSMDDFDSMCRIAMSSKRPDQGIGNKGVGFKSVLQLSASPEVYSRSAGESTAFDGFCLRFAGPADSARVTCSSWSRVWLRPWMCRDASARAVKVNGLFVVARCCGGPAREKR